MYYADCGVLKKQLERAMREVQGCSGAGPRSRKPFPQIKIYHYAPGEVRFDRTLHLSWSSVCLPTSTTTFTKPWDTGTNRPRPRHGEDIDSWSARLHGWRLNGV